MCYYKHLIKHLIYFLNFLQITKAFTQSHSHNLIVGNVRPELALGTFQLGKALKRQVLQTTHHLKPIHQSRHENPINNIESDELLPPNSDVFPLINSFEIPRNDKLYEKKSYRPSATRKCSRSRVCNIVTIDDELEIKKHSERQKENIDRCSLLSSGDIPDTLLRHQVFINGLDALEYLQHNFLWFFNVFKPLIIFDKYLGENSMNDLNKTLASQEGAPNEITTGKSKKHEIFTSELPTFKIRIVTSGGGLSAQASSTGTAIARTILNHYPFLRYPFKHTGLLTIDSRNVERKKVGLKKSRKAPQFSKR